MWPNTPSLDAELYQRRIMLANVRNVLPWHRFPQEILEESKAPTPVKVYVKANIPKSSCASESDRVFLEIENRIENINVNTTTLVLGKLLPLKLSIYRPGVDDVLAAKGPQTSIEAIILHNVLVPWERIAVDIAGPFSGEPWMQLIDARDFGEVTSVLQASWIEMGYLIEEGLGC
ncbi:hypothetical protein EVAR_18046_1 [Eumeta japonica]|uniref:Uncharacterized protein n=1 Tax=Eumeta variegata TaxID=151549 RepID=A0A4C1XW55_EUMVA|nr:hypothetical protein EVAR_18046_1 [Eumeta japonica]